MKKIQGLLLSVVLLFFAGCASQNRTGFSETLDEPTPTIALPASTVTAFPPTTTFTTLPTLTPLPSSTHVPALSEIEAQGRVLELLAAETDCDLPCWWGITPGKTSKDFALSYLNQFQKLMGFGNSPQIFNFNDVMDPPGIYFSFTVSYDQEIVNYIRVYTEQRNDPYIPSTKESMLVYLSVMEAYRLENILFAFGEPEHLWIRSFAPNYDWFDTETMLLYPELGFVVIYSSESTLYGADPMYTATCPNLSNIRMYLYDPQSESLLDTILEFEAIHKFMTVEEATGLSISEFSTLFQLGDCDTNLMTLSELWPSQYDNSED
ncbi:MAG TPA: hypothetical protein VJ965_06730 [Anaerolineales bacterium]|nr:hypothetical protein [Anaerolineales bacterium]